MTITRAQVVFAATTVVVVLSGAAAIGRSLVDAATHRAQAFDTRSQMTPASPSKPQSGAKGNAANGKTIYVKYGCYECHGYVGQGGAGPRLAPEPMALEAFTKIVRHPPTQMPPYTEKVVTNQELADIHAYLASLPRPRDPATIPLLKD